MKGSIFWVAQCEGWVQTTEPCFVENVCFQQNYKLSKDYPSAKPKGHALRSWLLLICLANYYHSIWCLVLLMPSMCISSANYVFY